MLPVKYTDRIKELLGEEADKYFDCFSKPFYQGLRINTLKINREEFQNISPYEVKDISWTKKGFYYDAKDKPAKHPYYYAGLYYIQEPSAMAPATFLPVESHDKVLDLCAAPGGKSTELAAKLDSTGVLVTNDISGSRAKALLKNIELSGVKNAIVTNEAPFELAKHFEGFFDKILVDAPCSGEGMFRKDPAIIKNWEQYGVEYYSKLQREIITYAAKMLKPGGYMLYSTCTFSPEEDEGTLRYLMENEEGFTVEKIDYDFGDCGHVDWLKFVEEYKDKDNSPYECIKNARRLWPHKINGEGHFVALLKKSEDVASGYPQIQTVRKSYAKDLPDEFMEFIKHIDIDFDINRFIVNKERIYYIPEFMLDVKGIKVLRNGLLMGEIKKNRFEPSQALACALKMQEYDNVINFHVDDERVIRYLKGETVEFDGDYSYNGWCLVGVDGYSLGFGKINKGTIKNKYLSGWRWM